MHVPAYEPVEWGVQAAENSGVVCELKKTMFICDIGIVLESMDIEDEDIESISVDMSLVSLSRQLCYYKVNLKPAEGLDEGWSERRRLSVPHRAFQASSRISGH